MNDYKNPIDPGKKFRVFISYAREDEIKAKTLYNYLKNSGLPIDPWIDKEDIYPGQDWDTEIIKSIKKVIFSSRYFLQFLYRKEAI